MRVTKFDVKDHLKTEEDIQEYLKTVEEDGTDAEIEEAKQDAAEARERLI